MAEKEMHLQEKCIIWPLTLAAKATIDSTPGRTYIYIFQAKSSPRILQLLKHETRTHITKQHKQKPEGN